MRPNIEDVLMQHSLTELSVFSLATAGGATVEHCGLDVLDFPATKLANKLAFGICCSLCYQGAR